MATLSVESADSQAASVERLGASHEMLGDFLRDPVAGLEPPCAFALTLLQMSVRLDSGRLHRRHFHVIGTCFAHGWVDIANFVTLYLNRLIYISVAIKGRASFKHAAPCFPEPQYSPTLGEMKDEKREKEG